MKSSFNKDPFEVLGVSRGASDEEIKNAYRALVKKYHPDNYDNDNPLKDLANEKMQEINLAYDTIQEMRHGNGGSNSYNGGNTYYQNYGGNNSSNNNYDNNYGSQDPIYADVRNDINRRRFADAERKLLDIEYTARVAEWHYLMSLVLMSRNNVIDAMRELEIACNMEPANVEYQRAKEMFNNNSRGYGSTYYGSAQGGGYRRRTSNEEMCDCCANLICLDCLCECMGGDLIACC